MPRSLETALGFVHVVAKSLLVGAIVAVLVYALAFGQGLAVPPLLGEAGSNAFWAQAMALIAGVTVFVLTLLDDGDLSRLPYGE